MSIVDAFINFFISRALEEFISFMKRHADLICNVEKYVKDIESELKSMKDSLCYENESTEEQWRIDLRELAYDIEDVIYWFEHGLLKGHKTNLVKIIQNPFKCHAVATRIKSIQMELHRIRDLKKNYTSNNGASSSSQHERHSSPEKSIDNPVGINDSIKELVDWLRAGRLVGMPRIGDWFKKLLHWERGLTPLVISVAGMSGIGKTFLVRQVYDNKKVEKHFKCRAWIKVPEPCTTEELLSLIISKLHNKKKTKDSQSHQPLKLHELVEKLKSFSHLKRYLLVLDDVWRVNELDVIKRALPSHRNGSRVIVTTTCSRKVRAYDRVYEVKPLQSDDAENLLRECESALSPDHDPISPHPSHAGILGKCEGLPLAILAIEWKKVYGGLDLGSIDVSRALSRLTYHYNRLPCHLKPCLLYLGIFPEGQLIKRKRLIQLWIAEGFIEENEEVADNYLKELADNYLKELVDYSMIQVAKRSYDGKVKSYKVHPLMRKFFILKAKEQNFYVLSTERQASRSSTVKIRRLSISGDDMNCSQDLSHVRSFFAFKSNQSLVQGFCSKFKYLRVLDLENAPLKKFPESLVKLKFLRYLSLANTDIRSLPKTIRKLKIVQVLNLKRTLISQLPEEIEKLTQLRHLLMYSRSSAAATPCFDDKQAVTVPRRIGSLVTLQELSMIQVNGEDDIFSLLLNLTQLRRLGVGGLRSENDPQIYSFIQQMKNVNSLYVKFRNEEEPLKLQYPSPSPSPSSSSPSFARASVDVTRLDLTTSTAQMLDIGVVSLGT